MTRILAFAGSLRAGSFNKKLVRLAATGARAAGAEVTELDLRDIPMPLYDNDIEREQGLPPNAKLFKRMLIEHDGLLVSTPEYNTNLTAVLKNAIDWASRRESGEDSHVAFHGKVGGIMATSPGKFGGVRSLNALRTILAHLGVLVVPGQLAIPLAAEAFDAEGNLLDERQREAIRSIGTEVVGLIDKLR